jgi:hypothetical protein
VNPLPRPANHEPTDAEIEAIVRDAIAAEAAVARREAAPPSSAIVWWRAQMRARQEAAKAVERPLTIVHAVAIACGLGLLASIAGLAIAVVKGSLGTISLATIDLTSRWITLPATAMLVSALVASVAALLIFADE